MTDANLRNSFVHEGKGEMAPVSGKAVAEKIAFGEAMMKAIDRGFSPIAKTKENIMVNARDYDMANKIAMQKVQSYARQH